MSPIGRIFIVLNLILAALFLGWASLNLATSHEYKGKYDAEVKAKEAAAAEFEDQIATLRGELDTKRTEADDARRERDQAVAAENREKQDNVLRNQQIADLTATGEKHAVTIGDFEAAVRNLEVQKSGAVAAQHDAEGTRDEALASAEEANSLAESTTQQNTELTNTIADLRGEIASLEGQVSELDTTLATLVDVTGVTLSDIQAQKLIQGSVLQADYNVPPGLVALNVGSNAEVKRGYTFEIFNGGQWKGQVRVENVREDMCTALVVKTYPGQTIQQGDSASTRL